MTATRRTSGLVWMGTSLGLLLVSAVASAAPFYTVRAIETLPGGTVNFALDISDTGYVTGNSRKGGSGSLLFPYVWRDGVATEIGLLPGVNMFGRGFAVNDAGLVVGESGNGPSKPFSFDGRREQPGADRRLRW